jgi:GntR family transcriptional regulator/MocR family aminotransferase
VTDWHTELPIQAALAQFIADGGLSRHIRRVRRVYRERHDLVVAALHGELARWLAPVPSAAGLHVSAMSTRLPAAGLRDVTASLRQDGVAIMPLSSFAVGPQQRAGLAIGYGMVSASDIGPGLTLLRQALQRGLGRRRGSAGARHTWIAWCRHRASVADPAGGTQ